MQTGGLLKVPLHREKAAMKFFENWWERAPLIARIGLVVLSIAGMLLGGAADAYWD